MRSITFAPLRAVHLLQKNIQNTLEARKVTTGCLTW